mmetsp:Transcript_33976/g.54692  ORF Transcript_33976/g.54692 Transcript_33976/m.54692 type:complete len:231 (+) Transcript_33976:566-1258(+)
MGLEITGLGVEFSVRVVVLPATLLALFGVISTYIRREVSCCFPCLINPSHDETSEHPSTLSVSIVEKTSKVGHPLSMRTLILPKSLGFISRGVIAGGVTDFLGTYTAGVSVRVNSILCNSKWLVRRIVNLMQEVLLSFSKVLASVNLPSVKIEVGHEAISEHRKAKVKHIDIGESGGDQLVVFRSKLLMCKIRGTVDPSIKRLVKTGERLDTRRCFIREVEIRAPALGCR